MTRELRIDVGEEIGDPDGILIIEGSAFVKKGEESCGVKRQWCGRVNEPIRGNEYQDFL